MKDGNSSFNIAQQHPQLWARQPQHQPVVYTNQLGPEQVAHARLNMLTNHNHQSQQHMSMPQGYINHHQHVSEQMQLQDRVHGTSIYYHQHHQQAQHYQQVQTVGQPAVQENDLLGSNFPTTIRNIGTSANSADGPQQQLRMLHHAEQVDDNSSDWLLGLETTTNNSWQDGHAPMANRPSLAYMNHHYQHQHMAPSQSLEQQYTSVGSATHHHSEAGATGGQASTYMIDPLYISPYVAPTSDYSYSYGLENQQQQNLAPQQPQAELQQLDQSGPSQLDGCYQQVSMHQHPHLLVSQEWLDTICRQMIEHMNSFGICVIDNFLGSIKGEMILKEVKQLFSNKSYTTGRLVSDKLGVKTFDSNTELNIAGSDEAVSQTTRPQIVDPAKTIRNDRVIWVDGCEEGCGEINNLIQTLCQVITNSSHLSLYSNNGLDRVVINKRTKAHVACYPGHGTRYIKHVDNPNGDGRVITAIYYLNKNWNTKRDGGLLRMFPTGVDTVANIEPLFDRVLFFWSDRRNPHEVLPAYRDRFAITVWYIGESRAQES